MPATQQAHGGYPPELSSRCLIPNLPETYTMNQQSLEQLMRQQADTAAGIVGLGIGLSLFLSFVGLGFYMALQYGIIYFAVTAALRKSRQELLRTLPTILDLYAPRRFPSQAASPPRPQSAAPSTASASSTPVPSKRPKPPEARTTHTYAPKPPARDASSSSPVTQADLREIERRLARGPTEPQQGDERYMPKG